MIELCKEHGVLVGQKQVTHRTPISERSKAAIEFIAMPELYVKQLDYKDDMRRMAQEMAFHDEKSRQILLDWIDSVSIDWPISRRRFYATEVPLWYCKKCKHPVTGTKGTYVQPWKDKAPVAACPKCKHTEFDGDIRVLDTWFDSSITPLYITKWHRDEAFSKNATPVTLRPQGKEIVRTWLYYTLLKCFQLTDKRIFDTVWVHFHVVDEGGRKMSKSLGNIIDPQVLLDKYGAEPFRFWAVSEGNVTTTDLRCSDDRVKGAGKTLTKLWNVARFSSTFPEAHGSHAVAPLDQWIRAELASLVKSADEQYAQYDFHNPSLRIRTFLWDTFASHYLELVKARAYNRDGSFSNDEQQSALATVHHCIDTLLKLMAPITPFITFKLYKELHGKDIHFETFPHAETICAPAFTTQELEAFNGMVWKAKKDAGLSLRAPVKILTLPSSLESIKKELQIMHGAQDITIGEAGISLA
ncbi:MAG: class I tRNA ligase family protein [Nanoarchaeota archaeon]